MKTKRAQPRLSFRNTSPRFALITFISTWILYISKCATVYISTEFLPEIKKWLLLNCKPFVSWQVLDQCVLTVLCQENGWFILTTVWQHRHYDRWNCGKSKGQVNLSQMDQMLQFLTLLSDHLVNRFALRVPQHLFARLLPNTKLLTHARRFPLLPRLRWQLFPLGGLSVWVPVHKTWNMQQHKMQFTCFCFCDEPWSSIVHKHDFHTSSFSRIWSHAQQISNTNRRLHGLLKFVSPSAHLEGGVVVTPTGIFDLRPWHSHNSY